MLSIFYFLNLKKKFKNQKSNIYFSNKSLSGPQMLSVSPGMERNGLSGGLEDDPSGGGGVGGGVGNGGEGATDSIQEVMVAAARDRAIRAGSVRQDLALDLPPRLQLPDGEERPYGAHTALHLRDPEQVSSLFLVSSLRIFNGLSFVIFLLGCKWLLARLNSVAWRVCATFCLRLRDCWKSGLRRN